MLEREETVRIGTQPAGVDLIYVGVRWDVEGGRGGDVRL